jgi:hypothetical protein
MVDNFMESYHHMGPHAKSLQPTNHAAETYCAEFDGPFAVLENPGANGGAHLLVYQVFPTFLGFVNEFGPIAGWYEMQIDRRDHFHLRIHALAAPALIDSVDPKLLLSEIEKIHLEDIPVCERVQRGISSRLYDPGPLSVQEGCLTRFHTYLSECLSAGAKS